ncbi:MAG: ferredoxin [Panacagrimonas sp.]|jgi:2Fe-2S ferredoxin|nr:2Fe-2S iron-sulfur cluster-binding protein [Panacagrimonas sp.]MCC2656943.1 ferredoxin [Panacagrimonas sp.]
MPKVHVKNRDGSERELDADSGCALMDALRDGNTGVEGTCGGMMSCGTCHVYVDADWMARLPARSDDEAEMLAAIGEIVEVRSTSRLSCQIPMSEELAGLRLEIGPPT